MNPLTPLFLVVLIGVLGVRLWLAHRHIRYVSDHRHHVPSAFEGRIPRAAHQKAADYTIAKARLGRYVLLFNSALLLWWTLGGGLNLIDRAWRSLEAGPIVGGVGAILSVLLIQGLLGVPFSAYRAFGLEKRFGFNRMCAATFMADLLKGALVSAIIAIPLATATLWLMEFARWWLYVWLVWMGFTLLMTWAYPTLIAPLYNRFSPLRDATLRARIEQLLERCGFNASGVFVIDGSKRSAHGNAYFSGFGRNKRIVFFDTLLDSLNAGQIESVLAHELGHFKRRHVIKNMAMTATFSLGALLLLAWLSNQTWFYAGLGVDLASNHMALLLFILVGPLFMFFLHPARAWLSRRYEFEADEFAAQYADAGNLIEALVTLYKDNANTLTPDPLHSAVYDSHPPAARRIAQLRYAAPAAATFGYR